VRRTGAAAPPAAPAALALAAIALAAIALGLVACGGSNGGEDAATVPEISVPAGKPQSVPEETVTPPETTTAPDSGGGGNGGGGGGGLDRSKPDSPTNDLPPDPGSPEARFEQFCKQNPGACG
jgi:hypothetical protein